MLPFSSSGLSMALLLGVLILLAVIIIVWRFFARSEWRQADRIKNRKRVAPIPTRSPLKDTLEQTKVRALRSLGMRFTILRNLLAAVVILLSLTLLAIPFVGTIPAAIFSTLVGIAVVVAGVAARPVLENLMGGILLTLSGSIHEGDTVIVDGHYGVIEDITPTHTVVRVWNWRRHVVPNATMMSKDFLNFTLTDSFLWAHVEFWVEPAADLQVVRDEAISAAKLAPTVADYEDPRFWVMELGKDGIRCWIAAWTNSPAEAWEFSHHVRTELSLALRKHRIRPHHFNIGHFNEIESLLPTTP